MDVTDEEPLVDVKAGQAPNLDIVLTGDHNTGIAGRVNFDEGNADSPNPFPNDADMCVFHRTITVANVGADLLTDIVVEGNVGSTTGRRLHYRVRHGLDR